MCAAFLAANMSRTVLHFSAADYLMRSVDALFIPLGWWHQVSALDFSVTITHTNFHWPNDFHTDYPADA